MKLVMIKLNIFQSNFAEVNQFLVNQPRDELFFTCSIYADSRIDLRMNLEADRYFACPYR